MSDDSQRPIIIKRIKKGHGGAHGGAWKIAYADFVTAMMAFFLLMWLLSSSTKATLKGIADYFRTPLKVALLGGEGSGDSSSIIKGGGTDLTRTEGQVSKTDQPLERRTINLQASRSESKQESVKNLQSLKAKIQEAIEKNSVLNQFKKQILIDMTNEGLRIQIVDEKGRPIFDGGSDRLKPYAKDILHEIGKVMNEVPNKVSVSGHTDPASYGGPEYGIGNWELSADRANSARRELIYGGMDDGKVIRVQGFADKVPLDKVDPADPKNRRIALLVLNRKTEHEITGEAPEETPAVPAPEEGKVPTDGAAPAEGAAHPTEGAASPAGAAHGEAKAPTDAAAATAAALDTAAKVSAGKPATGGH